MAKDWARKFYDSTRWKQCRDYILSKNNYVCKRCNVNAAEIVHHIIWLSPSNIDNVDITLGEDNLIPVCRECHAEIHEGVSSTIEELKFNEDGELIRR